MAHERKGLILGILGLSQLMIVLDASIVNVALPSIARDLGFKPEDLQWVVTAYTLMFGGFLLLGGRFADRLGRKKVFVTGLGFFVVASMLGGLAQTEAMLIAARALQGFGGAFMAPSALSIIAVVFREGEERNKAFGVWAAIAASGAAIGLLLGAVLVEYLSWQWTLFANAPLAAAALLLALKYVPDSKAEHPGAFDIAGAVTVTGGLMALVYTLVRGNSVGWTSTQTFATGALAVVLLDAFIVIEQRQKTPLLPLRIFQNRNLAGADLTMLVVGAGMFAMFFYMSLYVQDILGYTPLHTGLAFMVTPVAIGVSATIASKNLLRFGSRRIATTGLTIGAVGMLLMTRVTPDGDYLTHVALPLITVGLGMGMSFVSLTTAALSGVPARDSGLGSALLNTAQQIGGSLGLALLTAVTSARLNALGGDRTVAADVTSSFAYGFAVAAGLLILGAIIANARIRTNTADLRESAAVGAPAHIG